MVTRRTVLKGAAASAVALSSYGRWSVGYAADNPIRIGVMTPLSGPAETSGRSVKAGVEIAAAQINAEGGVLGRPIQLEFRDDKANVAQATAMAHELLGSGVNLLTGSNSSSVVAALGPVMQQENGVLIGTLASAASLNHENYNPNVFRASETPYARMRGLAQIASKQSGDLKRWSGIIPDTDFGHSSWETFVGGLKEFFPSEAGVEPEILDPIVVPLFSSDYKSYIADAMKTPFEGLFHATYGADSVTLFQQARPYGLTKKAKAIYDSGNEFVVAKAMKEHTPAWWGSIFWYYGNHEDNPMSNALYEDYAAKYNDLPPEGYIAEGHADIYAFAKAIETAGSTETAAVIDALKGMEWETATGIRTMRAEDNQAIKTIEAVYIEPADNENGWTISAADKVPGGDLIEPPSPGKKLE
ncbi:ABC transporter substrate-binding protein [Amorphus sp. 3PC139-8]|uniref:ABC transporter substrate-binding protein n=1 Tax=Amorphus sp. 3PC139-8 TaxID=2735676 RepID=UPI00345DCFB4